MYSGSRDLGSATCCVWWGETSFEVSDNIQGSWQNEEKRLSDRWLNMWRISTETRRSLESFFLLLLNILSGTMAPIRGSRSCWTTLRWDLRCRFTNTCGNIKWSINDLHHHSVTLLVLQVHLVPALNPDGFEMMSPSGRSWLPLYENVNTVDLQLWVLTLSTTCSIKVVTFVAIVKHIVHLRDFPTWRDFGQSKEQLLEKREPEVVLFQNKYFLGCLFISKIFVSFSRFKTKVCQYCMIFPDCGNDWDDSRSSLGSLS